MEEKKLADRVKCKRTRNGVLRDDSSKQTVKKLLEEMSCLTELSKDRLTLLKSFPSNQLTDIPCIVLHSPDTPMILDTRMVEVKSSGAPSVETPGASNTTESTQVTVDSVAKVGSDGGMSLNTPGTSNTQEVSSTTSSASSAVSPASSIVDLAADSEESMGEGVKGILMRQVVPSDNSCLFTSVAFALSGISDKFRDALPPSGSLRELISTTVASDTSKFNEAFLGRPNSDYAQWILKNESWGGGIELAILAEFYGVEIRVVDIQSLRICRFGEDKNYSTGIYLIYDGFHYDPIYLTQFNGQKTRTLFPTDDRTVFDQALQLGREAKAAHQYKDLNTFALKCTECNTLLRDQDEAQIHAKRTGHAGLTKIN